MVRRLRGQAQVQDRGGRGDNHIVINNQITSEDIAELLKDERSNLKLSNIMLTRQLAEARARIKELEDGNNS